MFFETSILLTQPDYSLHFQNTTIAIVGKDQPFTIMDDEDVARYVEGAAPPAPVQ